MNNNYVGWVCLCILQTFGLPPLREARSILQFHNGLAEVCPVFLFAEIRHPMFSGTSIRGWKTNQSITHTGRRHQSRELLDSGLIFFSYCTFALYSSIIFTTFLFHYISAHLSFFVTIHVQYIITRHTHMYILTSSTTLTWAFAVNKSLHVSNLPPAAL